jgi:rubrerythrin
MARKILMKIFQIAQNLQFVKTPEELDERETSRAIRDAIINEQLAIQQYEAIVDAVSDDKVKKVLQEIADEERVHVGELLALLNLSSAKEAEFLEDGAKEVNQD